MTESPHARDVTEALQSLAAALQDPDPTAWVAHYAEDAVFDGGGPSAVEGRPALMALASSMQPMRSVTITPLRIEAHADLAAVWFEGSWVSGPDDSLSERTRVRGLLVMRREDDCVWRVLFERIG